MSGRTAMRVKKGVSVPMDADSIHPASLIAALTVGIRTLADRSEASGDVLDWDTIEFGLRIPDNRELSRVPNHADTPAALLVVRAARVS